MVDRQRGFWIALVLALCLGPITLAEDIQGVQPAALDQPRVNVVVRRQPAGAVLTAAGGTFNVEAFLDTGASGIILSAHTAQQLHIQHEFAPTPDGKPTEVNFEDVGIGGSDKFDVSDPLFFSLGPYTPSANVDNPQAIPATYTQSVGPLRAQIGPLGNSGDFLTQLALADLDVVGMPALQGKIAVLDVRPVNTFTDTIRTAVYDAKLAAAFTKTKRHVKLSYASFARFTRTTPPAAAPPTLSSNPFIGPNPVAQGDATRDATPSIVIVHHGKSISGSWLLDTGAAASMISRKNAEMLDVRYVEGTFGTDNPQLQGVPAARQFVLSVGGIGGARKAAGFFLDELRLSTTEGQDLVFKGAPVLVADITVQDAATGRSFTLDGVFGMNFLVASCMLEGGSLLPDMTKLTPSAFERIVIDQPDALLGLQ
ncbi:MAG: pepsin/retropepsin-like aspartic protease family protein [Tepidisphaeraceae bacterium]|jgi:hypothetical protein